MIQNVISNHLAGLAGAYVGGKVLEEIKAEPSKNKNGEYVAKCSPTVKLVFGGVILASYLCSTFPFFLSGLFEKPEDRKLIWYLGIFLFVEATFLLVVLKKKLFYQYTLTKDALIIKKAFQTKTISYSELQEVGNSFPPMLYGCSMIFTSKSELIRLDYSYILGGVTFNLYFAEYIGHPLEEETIKEIIKRVNRGVNRPSRLEKKELKRRKQNIK